MVVKGYSYHSKKQASTMSEMKDSESWENLVGVPLDLILTWKNNHWKLQSGWNDIKSGTD